ncbi:GNAT family N-acetyltransferase [Paenibacillus albicereus]|uniref:GNAT family N-acetyltransferase n=1 Tax=Paenibacillus albicereus TaxID=2726185 RepID=A0A6H2GX83_9BACL|nr:GNAT family N-acetyltransferase [Paenibacillus albicereus]QJC52034.1 GNAT family N-acetyltransferase [Paenibacillus albicereus]
MDYYRITSIEDEHFSKLHRLLQDIFPPEEVLAYELWEGPLQDPGIHVCVALHDGEAVGATEYRYYPQLRVAMTDFTIIGRPGLGVGRFLLRSREKELARLAAESGTEPIGMFAEIYDPYRTEHGFGGADPMNPFVRREVLSHIGYKRLELDYVHPSWDLQGGAVSGLDLGFLPQDEELDGIPGALAAEFLETYYSAIEAKPAQWYDMVAGLKRQGRVALLPL